MARTYVIRYEIYGDMTTDNLIEIKQQMLDTFEMLSDRVDDQYYAVLIAEHLELFESDGIKARYQDGILTLVVKQGNGTCIRGELVKETCTVKPKGSFWLQEVFMGK